jgi:hypothetical protein
VTGGVEDLGLWDEGLSPSLKLQLATKTESTLALSTGVTLRWIIVL